MLLDDRMKNNLNPLEKKVQTLFKYLNGLLDLLYFTLLFFFFLKIITYGFKL